jgi:hypothetical protein
VYNCYSGTGKQCACKRGDHAAVRAALIKDGWTITHDLYTMVFGQKVVFVDLGAEHMLAAENCG